MKNQNTNNNPKSTGLLGLGLLTAIMASLCCITPVLALLAGTSGFAATFSWMEPFRPYLIGLTLIVLAFAWYQQLKPKNEIDCNCESEDLTDAEAGKPIFFHSKKFLSLITVFSIIMLAFPYYSYIFYPEKKEGIVENVQLNIQELNVQVEGMTCESCNLHVEHEISKLPGYLDATADYKTGTVKVKYNNTKTTEKEIVNTINSSGYKVVENK